MEPQLLCSGSDRSPPTIPGLSVAFRVAVGVAVATVGTLAVYDIIGQETSGTTPRATGAGPRSLTSDAASALGVGSVLIVGRGIQPGTYANVSAGQCHWTRFKRLSAGNNVIALSERFEGLRTISIMPTDAGFASLGCHLRLVDPTPPIVETDRKQTYPP